MLKWCFQYYLFLGLHLIPPRHILTCSVFVVRLKRLWFCWQEAGGTRSSIWLVVTRQLMYMHTYTQGFLGKSQLTTQTLIDKDGAYCIQGGGVQIFHNGLNPLK